MTRFYFFLAFALIANAEGFSKTCLISCGDPLLITLDTLHNPNCFDPLGYIAVTASGGTPNYTYDWNTGASGPILSGITAGEYVVIVTDSEGNTVDLKITVEDDFIAPFADAGAPLLIPCTNTPTSLDGSGSIGPEFTYHWMASNGGHILSGSNTLAPIIDQAGVFQLTVTNNNNGCTASETTTVTEEHVTPAAQVIGGVITCTNSSITLSVVYTTLNTTFIWQGPGGFSSPLANPVVAIVGNYLFTLTDTLTGCINKSTGAVTSNLVVPNAVASSGGNITCAQPTVQLIGTSTTQNALFNWLSPNGFMSGAQNPMVGNAGVYTLTVHNPINGCTATSSVTVTSNLVAPLPSASVSGTLSCTTQTVQLIGNSNTPGVTFNWVGPNNFTSALQNPMTSLAGLYTLFIKNPVNGCTGSATVNVVQNITPPNISATGGLKTCSVPAVTLMGSSMTFGATFSWTGPNGFTSAQQNPSVSVTGIYTLKVTNPQNGCTATATTNISQNITPPSISATSGSITCTKPLAQITTASSPQGLSYAWTGPNNFNSTLQNPMVSVPGYYYLTATNPANGCTNTSSVYTDSNTTPPLAYTGEDKSLNCYFTSIIINASFSSNGPNYTYLWTTDEGNIVSGANSLYPRVDAVGIYTLTVTNTQNGCTNSHSMEVTQSTPVTAAISQTTPVYCSGGANGTASVVAGGGSGIYTYRWSSGSLNATVTGLSAGVYTVTVTDTDGCSTTATATINQLVLAATVNVTPQTMSGVNNGTASITGSGGTAPYTAKWSNGAMTLAINNLAPGPYTVTLTDTRGCTLVATANINAANCVMTGSISGANVSCFGANNGSATVNLNSAVNPIVYAWSNAGTTKTVSGLAPGTYTVTATDGASCQIVQIVQISSPQPLMNSVVSQTDVNCPNSADGTLMVGVTGGTKPYTYNWSNNASSATLFNLASGTYTITVTDANNCTSTVSAQINNPIPITISILLKTDVACPGSNTGLLTVSAQGGIPPYHYFWSNGSTFSAISGLVPGSYSLTVTDANDCPKSLSTQILATDQTPPVLNLKNASVDLDNNGFVAISSSLFDNGSTDDCGIASWTVTPNTLNCNQIGQNTVTITATDLSGQTSSGTAIVTVLDNFSPSVICPANISTGYCSSIVQFNLPQVTDNCPINPEQLVQLSGLPSGTSYPTGNTHQAFQYTDPSGNIGQCSFEVFVVEPATLTSATIPTTCASACDGATTLTQLNGGIQNIAWSNGQTGLNLTGLCSGTYTATITDAYNCTQTTTAEVAVLDVQAPNLSCPTNMVGSFCSLITYNQPVVTDNCPTIQANLQLIAGLPSGAIFPIGNTVQTFSYNDNGGNSGQCSFTVNIAGPSTQNAMVQPVTCTNLCNGSAQLTINGGNGPFNVHWSNGQNGLSATNLCAGDHAYTLTDFAGCSQLGSISVSQPDGLVVSVTQIQNDHGNTGAGSIQINATGGTPPYIYYWTKNGQFYSAVKDLFNLFQGQYVAVITDANGCTSSSGILTVSNTVGTRIPDWTQPLTISPNPATESIQIDFGAPLCQTAEFRLCSPNGQVLGMQTIDANNQHAFLDLSSIPAGIWLVWLSLADGQSTIRKLVLIK